MMHAGVNGSSRQQLDQCFTSFSKLQTEDRPDRAAVLSDERKGEPFDRRRRQGWHRALAR